MSSDDRRHWFRLGDDVALCGARREHVGALPALRSWLVEPFTPKCHVCLQLKEARP